jgi:hypothetical protein
MFTWTNWADIYANASSMQTELCCINAPKNSLKVELKAKEVASVLSITHAVDPAEDGQPGQQTNYSDYAKV